MILPRLHRPRNLQKTGYVFLIVLCIAVIFTAGCVGSGTNSAASAPVPSTTPAASTIASSRSLPVSLSLDPIVGIWRSPGPAYQFRIAFDVNGKTQETFANQPAVIYNGTWKLTGGNTYLVTRDTGEKMVWIYSPDSNTICKQAVTGITYSLYQGVAGANTSAAFFSGTGDMVVPFTATGTGRWVFTMSYSGSGNYIVWLTDNLGSRLALLANGIGTYSGVSPRNLDTGKYYLNVTASGPWTIQATLS